MQIGEHHFKGFLGSPFDPPLGCHLNNDGVPFRLQQLFIAVRERFVVLDHQNLGSWRLHESCSTGNTIRNVVPTSIFVSKSSDPRCVSTIRSAIESPRPDPPALVVKNGSKSRSCTSCGMPRPVSSTSMTTTSAGCLSSSAVSRRA